MRRILYCLLYVSAVLALTSCSSDYTDAIPAQSKALVRVDMAGLAEVNSLGSGDKAEAIKDLLHVDDPSDCGIDISRDLYFFVSPEGTLGLCAAVGSGSAVEEWFGKLHNKGLCTKVSERRGCHFTILHDSWVVGFNDDAILIMGPSVSTEQPNIMQRELKYLSQKEGQGLRSSPYFEKLDTIQSYVAMVAQAQSLPDMLVAPFTLGAPKDTDPSDVLIAANMNIHGGLLDIVGETYSLNPDVDKALKASQALFRPLNGRYINTVSSSSLFAILMNIKGTDLLAMMKDNRPFMAMLAGVNTKADFDNILRRVDGDIAIVIDTIGEKGSDCAIAAQLSEPIGDIISDPSRDRRFVIGQTDDKQMYCGTTETLALAAVNEAPSMMPSSVREKMKGRKLCMVLNVSEYKDDTGSVETLLSMLRPIFGDVNVVSYSMK